MTSPNMTKPARPEMTEDPARGEIDIEIEIATFLRLAPPPSPMAFVIESPIQIEDEPVYRGSRIFTVMPPMRWENGRLTR